MQIKCKMLQGSILASSVFLIYGKNLGRVSKYLTSMVFADDINLFCSHNDLKILFENANNELKRILTFKANKVLRLIS